jgi:SAM-dependent methyltransferase
VLDLGCGQALLAAVLLAARRQFDAGVWPDGWPAPPAHLVLYGIEMQDGIAQWGRIALGSDVRIETGNAAGASLPEADVIVLFDVLHYLEPDAQTQLLKQAAGALKGVGRMLVRVADAAAGLSFQLTRLADRLGSATHFRQLRRSPRLHCRTAAEWISLLQSLGFEVEIQPIDRRAARANLLLHARTGAVGLPDV